MGLTLIPNRAAVDRCPGLIELHEAADGWLARVRIPGGRLDVEQLEAIKVASGLGNGVVELTSRGNLQVRGLPAGASGRLARLLGEAGLFKSETHDRVRNVIASPIPGRHPQSLADTDALVVELDEAIRGEPRLSDLSGKFLFSVDDGAGIALDPQADVGLSAVTMDAGVGYRLSLAGGKTSAAVTPEEAPALASAAAMTFLSVRERSRSEAWRIEEISDGAEQIAEDLGVEIIDRLAASPRQLACGVLLQRDGRFAITALPRLGRLSPETIEGLASLIATEGLAGVRVAPARTLTFTDLPQERVEQVATSLKALGLIVEPDSAWEGLTACAGLGACANAEIDVRAIAEARVPARASRGGGRCTEHWSACDRRCGEPRRASIKAFSVGGTIDLTSSVGHSSIADSDSALATLAAQETS